jgi:hypothetical protein
MKNSFLLFAALLALAACSAQPSPANDGRNPQAHSSTPKASLPVVDQPASARPADAALTSLLPTGQTLGARADGDLNGDGQADVSFVGISGEHATLYVALAPAARTGGSFTVIAKGPVAAEEPSRASVAVERGILTVDFEYGGTTRWYSVYRLRYDPPRRAMRLIGFDMATFDRAPEPDTDEVGWNLLTGETVRKVSKARADGSGPKVLSERRGRTLKPPIYLEKLPEPTDIEMMLARK